MVLLFQGWLAGLGRRMSLKRKEEEEGVLLDLFLVLYSGFVCHVVLWYTQMQLEFYFRSIALTDHTVPTTSFASSNSPGPYESWMHQQNYWLSKV